MAISGSQVVDGVSILDPTSYLVGNDPQVGDDEDLFLPFAEAGLSSTPVASLFWVKEGTTFHQLSDNQALAAVPAS